jgi:peptidoglycan/xylan/chitin deacetylase (PgdA/CDA1 family)
MLPKPGWKELERIYALRALLLGRFPHAVRGVGADPNDSVAVFAQHAPGPKYLLPKIEHIRANGYAAIDSREYRHWLDGDLTLRQPTLMLTFDDGLRRFKDVTFPLLRDAGLKSVLFVCSGIVELASGPPSQVQAFVARDMLTWPELAELEATGLVDVQSHGLWHNKVRLANGTATQSARVPANVFEAGDLLPPDGRLELLLGANGRDVSVLRYPGAPFFLADPASVGSTHVQSVRDDLARSRSLIRDRLGKDDVRAFAFPWWNGSQTARRAAVGVGFDLIFEGSRGLTRRAGPHAVERHGIGRLSFDYVHCLVGARRTSVPGLILEKLRGKHAIDYA